MVDGEGVRPVVAADGRLGCDLAGVAERRVRGRRGVDVCERDRRPAVRREGALGVGAAGVGQPGFRGERRDDSGAAGGLAGGAERIPAGARRESRIETGGAGGEPAGRDEAGDGVGGVTAFETACGDADGRGVATVESAYGRLAAGRLAGEVAASGTVVGDHVESPVGVGRLARARRARTGASRREEVGEGHATSSCRALV
ncbi:hypothetical protein [Halarchaeum acidiphilum]|uniref:hypothetical protein n=1 Tax=Halarchaeum acidiphilum TaxID=489138 RepID=UPI0006781F1B|nr:hypothetical protein [Halarchaeum acidiphilum]